MISAFEKLTTFTAIILVSWLLGYMMVLLSRKRSDVILQRGLMDCGLACVQMVGLNYKKSFDYAYIAKSIKLSKSGVSFTDIQSFFENEGFVAEGFRNGIEFLESAAGNVIASVQPNHFVVVESYLKTGIFVIKDPAAGRLYIPKFLMRLWYKGVYIAVRPGTESPRIHRTMRQR